MQSWKSYDSSATLLTLLVAARFLPVASAAGILFAISEGVTWPIRVAALAVTYVCLEVLHHRDLVGVADRLHDSPVHRMQRLRGKVILVRRSALAAVFIVTIAAYRVFAQSDRDFSWVVFIVNTIALAMGYVVFREERRFSASQ